ncbi:hypothetical protein K492DRAFT_198960, partial [Lichtheimia hyalospora FSU 10163]
MDDTPSDIKDKPIYTPIIADKKKKAIDLSDSDNDSDDQGGLTGVDNLNISARLKRLMRDTTLTNALDNDDDSDDDDPLKDNVFFRTPAAVKTPAVQSLLQTDPSPRPDKSNSDNSSSDNEEDDMAQQQQQKRRRQPEKTRQKKTLPTATTISDDNDDDGKKKKRPPKRA